MKQSIEAIGPVRGGAAARDPVLQASPDVQTTFDMRERFEAALRRALPESAPAPIAVATDDPSKAPRSAFEMPSRSSAIAIAIVELPTEAEGDAVAPDPSTTSVLRAAVVAFRRPGIDDEVNDASADDVLAPLAVPLPVEPMRVTSAGELPAAVGQVVPISATAAAVQRLQAAATSDRSAPWRIAFGERDATASGLAALVVTPSAQGPAQWRVVASAGMQAVLAARIEGLRARLAERGVKGGVIAVSEQEGDDESQG